MVTTFQVISFRYCTKLQECSMLDMHFKHFLSINLKRIASSG
jgi:hypothetical protein